MVVTALWVLRFTDEAKYIIHRRKKDKVSSV